MSPTCSTCRAESVAFSVPESIVAYAPAESAYAATCQVCLTVDPLDEAPSTEGDLNSISEALPPDAEHAAATLLIVGLLESLAMNRPHIEAIVDYLEGEGVDALLVLNRLAEDTSLRPALDLERRVYQLEQLLG